MTTKKLKTEFLYSQIYSLQTELDATKSQLDDYKDHYQTLIEDAVEMRKQLAEARKQAFDDAIRIVVEWWESDDGYDVLEALLRERDK